MARLFNADIGNKIKFYRYLFCSCTTSKSELLNLWNEVINKNEVKVKEHCKVETIIKKNDLFEVATVGGQSYSSNKVLIAIGRRGTPRKLGLPGEDLEKVAYKILEPEIISGKNILV